MPFCLAPAAAKLLIQIDKWTQRMTVSEDGDVLYRWPVSTGVARYARRAAAYKPFRMEKDHRSEEWDDAPMPYSIFFTRKGDAIHGTNEERNRPAVSHGCVRLSRKNAAMLWKLVKQEKMANTEVVLFGHMPGRAPAVAQEGAGREITAAAAPSYSGAGPMAAPITRTNGRTYYDDRPPPPPPDYVPERRYRTDDGPLPFPFFLFGR